MLQDMASGRGSAPPTRVFIHGFTGAVASWEGVCAHLGATHRHVGLRVPGHHPDVSVRAIAADPHAEDAFDRIVSALAHALAGLGGSPCHLVGYSLGARLALALLLRMPERFAHVTLLGGHPGLQSREDRIARATQDARWERILREEGMQTFLQRWLAQPMFAHLHALPAGWMLQDGALRASHEAHALADALAAMSLARMPSQWESLGDIGVPMCFAAGDKDDKFATLLQAAHARSPGSVFHRVQDAGHNVVLEAPTQVAQLILAMEARLR